MAKKDTSNLQEHDIKFSCWQPVKYSSELLEDEMSGIKRLPALMFSEPDRTLEELNLYKCEILNNDPVHDVSNHIKNLYFQTPFQFKQKN